MPSCLRAAAVGISMNNLAKNYIYTSGYQILGILLTLVTTPYLTRVLGSGSLGIDSFVLSIVQICEVIGSLGTTIYGNREIAYVRGDKNRLRTVFWELLCLRLLLGVPVCGIYLLIAFRSRYRIVFLVQLIALVSYYLDISWLYFGLEDVRPVTLYSAFAKITATVLIFTLIKKPEHLLLYVAISAASQATVTMLLLLGARGRVGRFRRGETDLRRHLRPVIALFLPQAASSLYVLFDKTMLGLLASDVSRTSIYDKAEVIVKAPVVLAAALTTVLMPRIANCYKQGKKDEIRKLIRLSLQVMSLLFVPVSAGMAIVAGIFIPAYLGPGYADSARVVHILSPIILAIALSNVSGAQFLIGCNKTKYLAASYFASAVFNIVGNYFLIPRLDEVGASLTTLLSEWMVVAIQFYAMRKLMGHIGIFRIIWKKIFAVFLMGAAIIPIGLAGKNLYAVFFQISAGIVVYFLALVLLRDEGLANAVSMLRGDK